MSKLVSDWFGESFTQLDPLIQHLHTHSPSILEGEVLLTYANGLAGFFGKRIGAKLGLPPSGGAKTLIVEINSNHGRLLWSRVFDSRYKMVSSFTPYGTHPDGCWREETGSLRVDLGVLIQEGGWYWQQKKVSFMSVPLPLWLFPSSHAYKRISDGKYEFSVSISLPWLGELLSYGGQLALREPQAN